MEYLVLYPVRCLVSANEDQYGKCIDLRIMDANGDTALLRFNDSHDCAMLDCIARASLQISDQLYHKRVLEEVDWECRGCPDD